MFETLHQIAAAAGTGSQGRKLELLGGLLARATPLEARYLARTVTGSLRLGVGTPTILDALALVHTGSRTSRPVLERAYNSAPTWAWSRPPWSTVGWPRWRRSGSAPATRSGPCWPSG